MAGPIIGITAALSWGGTQHASLAGTGVEGRQFTLNIDAESVDSTTFASTSGPTLNIKGMRSATGTFQGLLKSPDFGTGGLVTFSEGTVINVTGWDIELNRVERQSTVFNATAPTFQSYVPGLWTWSGTFTGYLDDTTPMTLPANASEPATGTFKYQEKGGTDNTLSGSIFTSGARVSASMTEVNALDYDFQGSGPLTQSTPSAGVGIFPSGAIGNEGAQEMELTASTGRTFTFNAFWTSVRISCRLSQLVTVDVGFRVTGPIAVA